MQILGHMNKLQLMKFNFLSNPENGTHDLVMIFKVIKTTNFQRFQVRYFM